MGGFVARIGDSISCGDHLAQGSSNVFVNGMPVATAGAKTTTGHGCFPPTVLISGFSNTVFVNNQPVAIQGLSRIQLHVCGKSKHDGVVVTGSPSVSVEA